MKTAIHPKWFPDAKVICACGNTFTTGATLPEVNVEICYSCHPFYTGTMRFVDTAGRVDSFKAKMAGKGKKVMSKTEKRRIKKEKKLQEEFNRPGSLEQLRNQV
jgi:large subunit ribosomal protein L31